MAQNTNIFYIQCHGISMSGEEVQGNIIQIPNNCRLFASGPLGVCSDTHSSISKTFLGTYDRNNNWIPPIWNKKIGNKLQDYQIQDVEDNDEYVDFSLTTKADEDDESYMGLDLPIFVIQIGDNQNQDSLNPRNFINLQNDDDIDVRNISNTEVANTLEIMIREDGCKMSDIINYISENYKDSINIFFLQYVERLYKMVVKN